MAQEDNEKQDGVRMIAGAIIGMDYRLIVVNDKSYIIMPPTIAKIAGASFWLTDLSNGTTLREILSTLSKTESLAKALSWFIQGNDELADELAQGSMTEVMDGLEAAFSMIEVENFIKLSALQRSAKLLIAKPK